MIRLYVDQTFSAGGVVNIPKEELRYFQTVRRAQGDVCLFNQMGEVAYGKIHKSSFTIERVEESKVPLYPLHLVMALPDSKILANIIRGISELGISKLTLFRGRRSQASPSKLNAERLQKVAVESSRQCGRGKALHIQFESGGLEKLSFEESQRFFFDEAGSHLSSASKAFAAVPSLLALGPEGGWTEEERDIARQMNFQIVHFKTPILRVETASIAAVAWGLEKIFHLSEG